LLLRAAFWHPRISGDQSGSIKKFCSPDSPTIFFHWFRRRLWGKLKLRFTGPFYIKTQRAGTRGAQKKKEEGPERRLFGGRSTADNRGNPLGGRNVKPKLGGMEFLAGGPFFGKQGGGGGHQRKTGPGKPQNPRNGSRPGGGGKVIRKKKAGTGCCGYPGGARFAEPGGGPMVSQQGASIPRMGRQAGLPARDGGVIQGFPKNWAPHSNFTTCQICSMGSGNGGIASLPGASRVDFFFQWVFGAFGIFLGPKKQGFLCYVVRSFPASGGSKGGGRFSARGGRPHSQQGLIAHFSGSSGCSVKGPQRVQKQISIGTGAFFLPCPPARSAFGGAGALVHRRGGGPFPPLSGWKSGRNPAGV